MYLSSFFIGASADEEVNLNAIPGGRLQRA